MDQFNEILGQKERKKLYLCVQDRSVHMKLSIFFIFLLSFGLAVSDLCLKNMLFHIGNVVFGLSLC